MSVTVVYTVHCDRCSHWYGESIEGKAQARREVARRGWLLTPDKRDLCPRCRGIEFGATAVERAGLAVFDGKLPFPNPLMEEWVGWTYAPDWPRDPILTAPDGQQFRMTQDERGELCWVENGTGGGSSDE